MNKIKEGYKQTELGLIPVDWEVKKLKEVTKRIIVGLATAITDYYRTEGVPLLRNTNIKNGYFDDSDMVYLDKEFCLTQKNKSVKENDVIVVRTGSNIGLTCLVPIKYSNSQTFTTLIVTTAKELLYPKYFVYHMNSESGLKEVQRLQVGGGKSNLNSSHLEQYIILLPKIPEQKKIASILTTWDNAIEKTEKLIETKTKLKKALMQQLLKGKKRFKEFIKSNEYKQTELGFIPVDWEIIKAKDIFKSFSSKNHQNEELLSVTQDKGVLPRNLLETRVTMPDGDTKGYKLVESGDFVISLRSFQGGLEYSNYTGIVSPAYTIIKNIIEIHKDFYKFYFKTENFIRRLAVTIVGIRDGKQISFSQFSEIYILMPPLPEQEKIASVLTSCDKEIELLEKKLETLKNQKKGLMQKLLTGQIRVKV